MPDEDGARRSGAARRGPRHARSSRRGRATPSASAWWCSPASRSCRCGSTRPGRRAAASRGCSPASFGVAAVLFPLVGAWWGVVLLRDVAREDRVRMFIGFVVLGAGVLGIVSIAARQPEPARRATTGVHDAAGLVGAAAGVAAVARALAVRRVRRLPRPRRPRAPDLHRHAVAAVIERIGELRAERAERDPVGGPARASRRPSDARRSRRARRSIREALGFEPSCPRTTDPAPVVVDPRRGRRPSSADPEDLVEELRGDPPTRRPPRPGRAAAGLDPDGRLPAAAARPAPRGAAVHRRRPRRGRTMEALERTFSTFGVAAARRRAPPRPDRHDVRGRGRGGDEGQQGPAACRATSPTRSPRPTSASSRRSPASRRSASRCRTRSATS